MNGTDGMELDSVDRQLLNLLQRSLPLEVRPFDPFVKALGRPTAELLKRTQRLKDMGIIRQISAIFDTRRLGYHSTLIAARVAPERLDAAAEVISGHPGVSHNYARNHKYNLWFTLAVSPDSRLGLKATAERLGQMAGVDSILLLPTLKQFKIAFHLDMTDSEDSNGDSDDLNGEAIQTAGIPVEALSEEDQEVVRALQRDLPLVEHPFRVLGKEASLDEHALIERGCRMLQQGVMRRFAAVLRHREAGFHSNAMGVWVVPEGRVEAVGLQMAQHPRVSHCYQRPAYPDWPYSLYTMVHGRADEECEGAFREMSEATGVEDYAVLYSTKEFKKVRVRYLTPEEAQWEDRQLDRLGCSGKGRVV